MSHDTTRHPYGEFEHAGWQRAAPAYADTFGRISSTFIPDLLDSAGITAGTVMLDVACGPGLVSAAAAARGARVAGVDFSPNMVTEARRRNPGLTFQEGDAEALPFADASFDAVVIGFGLHHFPLPGRAIAEARRVLRPGGRLGFTTWAPPEDHVTHQIVLGAVREAGNAGAALPVAPGGPVNQTGICLRLLQDAGFDAAQCRTQILRKHLRLESATELIGMLEAGTVRLSTTLRSQPADKTAAIHAAVERNMAPFRDANGYQFPVAAILGTATK